MEREVGVLGLNCGWWLVSWRLRHSKLPFGVPRRSRDDEHLQWHLLQFDCRETTVLVVKAVGAWTLLDMFGMMLSCDVPTNCMV